MNNLLTLIVGLVLFAMIAALIKTLQQNNSKSNKPSLYEKEEALMTPAELLFFKSLESALGNEFRLFSKVRIADIVRVKRNDNRGAWQSAFNVIQSKHIDFLAVNPSDMSIQFAVELDDKSHHKPKRQARDENVDRILTEVGVPIFRFPAKGSYYEKEIRAKIFEENKIVEHVPPEGRGEAPRP